ncbi:hypothetical protein RUM4293_00418 [Ruegeria atlantica]|uniref:Uncharacterized protein n=1 Tax=Ruegeria atlantica TaxID=81569 RepID=A0A0P1E139_9RHOB|nr:hypothetical protein RUM4293_00418 [Ruegeria atlantica]
MTRRCQSIGLLLWSFFVSVGLKDASADEQSGDEEVLLAAGGKWFAQGISWTEYNGHWRVRTIATLVDISEVPLQFGIALTTLDFPSEKCPANCRSQLPWLLLE